MEFTNNIEQGTGRVNCVGFFNNGGNSFFTMNAITTKINEISDFLVKHPNDKEMLLLMDAALSIRAKLRQLEIKKHKQIIEHVDNLFNLLREANGEGLSSNEKTEVINSVINTQPKRVQWELTQKFGRKFNLDNL